MLFRSNLPVPLKDAHIELNNVSFSYSKDKKILKNINLSIDENQVTAFVGESGSGKSTITKLIAQQVRIPAGKGNVRVRCPRCGDVFDVVS